MRKLSAVLAIIAGRFDRLLLLLDHLSFHRAARRRQSIRLSRLSILMVVANGIRANDLLRDGSQVLVSLLLT